MTVVRITLMMGIFCYGLHAQETPIADIDRTAPAKEVFDDDGSRVAVLGYHVFHKTLPATQMRIPTSKFRSQMEAIRKSNIAPCHKDITDLKDKRHDVLDVGFVFFF